MKKMIIASTSTIYGGGYLEYLLPEISGLFEGCKTVLFVPYARPGGISHDAYTARAVAAFEKIGIKIKGIHEYFDPVSAVKSAEGIFIGGGNTFLLIKQLYDNNLMTTITDVVEAGTPYLGSSAGSNITGISMQTTNDMPIVYPPDFRTMGLIPFNLNPHYLDPDTQSKHMGESRETRIKEFHAFNDIPVLGLREGSWLRVEGKKIVLEGELPARLFRRGMEAVELERGTNLNNL